MIKILFTVVTLLILSACGGGGGGSPKVNTGGVSTTISGTAATGKAFAGVVNIYGSNGGTNLNVLIDPAGNYSADAIGLTPPFLLCAVPANGSGLAPQSSFAGSVGVANITPLTTLAVFNANSGQDPCATTPESTWPTESAAVKTNLPDEQARVNANFDGVFPAMNIDFTIYDFFTTKFKVGDEIDKILDVLGVDVSSGSPVITANGSVFNFDPSIDFSGIDIGGIGGGSGGGGSGGGGSTGSSSVALAGKDTKDIGTSYVPTIGIGSTVGSASAVSWGDARGAAMGISVTSNQLATVSFSVAEISSNTIGGVYSYNISCWPVAEADCKNISLDVAGKSITFNKVTLKAFQSVIINSLATGPITVDGTLYWEDIQ